MWLNYDEISDDGIALAGYDGLGGGRLSWFGIRSRLTPCWGSLRCDSPSPRCVWALFRSSDWSAGRLSRAPESGCAWRAGYLLQTYGLRYTSPTNSGLITGLFVVFAPIANYALFRIRIARVFLLPLGICLVGTLLLVGESPQAIRIGDGLTLGCAACFGLHIALLSRYAHRHDATALALAQMIATAALCGLAWLLFESPSPPPAHVWFALIVTGVLASAAAFTVQTYVQQRLSATRTAIILTMEPVFAVFFGYVLAGDRLSWIQVAGAVLILVAIAASEVIPALKRD